LSDLFIAALAEIEAQVVAEITNVVLEVELGQLESVDGREKLTSAIRDQVNKYLEEDLDMFPGITEVFIINYNVI
jgi:flagellar basal body-associated protein FliL